MDMHMGDGLSGHLPHIKANIKTLWPKLLFQEGAHHRYHLPHAGYLLLVQIEIILHMSLRYNQHMPRIHRILIIDGKTEFRFPNLFPVHTAKRTYFPVHGVMILIQGQKPLSSMENWYMDYSFPKCKIFLVSSVWNRREAYTIKAEIEKSIQMIRLRRGLDHDLFPRQT
jgi:hypothetical protein